MQDKDTHTNYNRKPGAGKKWLGLILLFLGVILLSRSLGLWIPGWIISWPMILIAIGVITGMNNKFRKPSSVILIFIGGVFLLGKVIPGIDFHNFVLPILVIGLGFYLILGRRRAGRTIDSWKQMHTNGNFNWDKRVDVDQPPVTETTESTINEVHEERTYKDKDTAGYDTDDFIDLVSIFGSIKKNVVSKNFKGGDIVTIMGGAEINLSQADFHGTIVIDVTQVFGGTKIILPPQWKLISDLAALFGGIEDKRPLMQAGNLADDKVLIIKGTSIFGGIDIRSY